MIALGKLSDPLDDTQLSCHLLHIHGKCPSDHGHGVYGYSRGLSRFSILMKRGGTNGLLFAVGLCSLHARRRAFLTERPSTAYRTQSEKKKKKKKRKSKEQRKYAVPVHYYSPEVETRA